MFRRSSAWRSRLRRLERGESERDDAADLRLQVRTVESCELPGMLEARLESAGAPLRLSPVRYPTGVWYDML